MVPLQKEVTPTMKCSRLFLIIVKISNSFLKYVKSFLFLLRQHSHEILTGQQVTAGPTEQQTNKHSWHFITIIITTMVQRAMKTELCRNMHGGFQTKPALCDIASFYYFFINWNYKTLSIVVVKVSCIVSTHDTPWFLSSKQASKQTVDTLIPPSKQTKKQ